jgi:predicted ATP-grasp superfamily ATP-dependent carboligase
VVETDHGKLAMGRRLGSLAIAVVVTSDGALAPGTTSVMVVMAVGPHSSGGLALKFSMRRVDGAAVEGLWRLSFLARKGHITSYL